MPRKAVLGIIALVVVVGIAAYILAFRVLSPPTGLNGNGTVSEEETQDTNLTQLSNRSLLAPTLLADGQTIRTYEATNGHVRDIDLTNTGTTVRVSDTMLDNLRNVWWSPDDKTVVTLRDNNGSPLWTLYNYISGAALTLDSSVSDVAFSPNSARFAYALSNGTESVLYISSIDGSAIERLATLPDPRPLLWWNTPQTILAAQRPTGLDASRVWRVDLTGEQTQLGSDRGLDILPSPDGSRILHSSATNNGRSLTLQASNAAFENTINLALETLIQKCQWADSNTTVICAVPNTLPSGPSTPLPDAYLWGEILTNDSFVVINTSSGRIVQELSLNTPVDATNLIVPSTRDRVVFINRLDGYLYQLRIPGGL